MLDFLANTKLTVRAKVNVEMLYRGLTCWCLHRRDPIRRHLFTPRFKVRNCLVLGPMLHPLKVNVKIIGHGTAVVGQQPCSLEIGLKDFFRARGLVRFNGPTL